MQKKTNIRHVGPMMCNVLSFSYE